MHLQLKTNIFWNSKKAKKSHHITYSIIVTKINKSKTKGQHDFLLAERYNKYSCKTDEHISSNDKRLVVFRTGMEKPPTFCHLSSGSELGLQLYMGAHILTTVPWPHRLGTAAAWLPWPDTACWTTTVSRQTWENRHIQRQCTVYEGCLCPVLQAKLHPAGVDRTLLFGKTLQDQNK